MYQSKTKKLTGLLAVMLSLLFVLGSSVPASADASSKTFKVLTYNVAGLPDIFSSGNPDVNTVKISPKLNNYEFVAVQEDFAYHSDLIGQATHTYKTSHSGNVPFGDGMNFLSKVPFNDVKRVTWRQRHGLFDQGSDQLTPKGFVYSQVILEPGIYVDVYTLHTDAGDDSESLAARRDNINQLAEYINLHSQGHAVIVLGDTNSRYTRSADNFETALLQACGLSDPWIQRVRNGSVPADGTALQTLPLNGPDYEVVDKVFYRSSPSVTLTPTVYKLEDTYLTDSNGAQLSDHYGISVTFGYVKNSGITLSDLWGGDGGTAFNFLRSTAPTISKPTSITLRAGTRVDGISMTYANGTVLDNGGTGGTAKTLNLAGNEYITSALIYKNAYNGVDRIFYAEFTTNLGQKLSGGTKSGQAITLTAPSGHYIAGLFGRAGTNVDKLGVVYKTLPLPAN